MGRGSARQNEPRGGMTPTTVDFFFFASPFASSAVTWYTISIRYAPRLRMSFPGSSKSLNRCLLNNMHACWRRYVKGSSRMVDSAFFTKRGDSLVATVLWDFPSKLTHGRAKQGWLRLKRYLFHFYCYDVHWDDLKVVGPFLRSSAIEGWVSVRLTCSNQLRLAMQM